MIIPHNFSEWLRDSGAFYIDSVNRIKHANTRQPRPPQYYAENPALAWRGKQTESLGAMGITFKGIPWK